MSRDRGFLLIQCRGAELGRVPLDDIDAVLATAHGVTLTTGAIAALAERGTPLVICNQKLSPCALLWPVDGYHRQQRRMEKQVTAARELTAALWGELVSAKIMAQARSLGSEHPLHARLCMLARTVTAGDPRNLEAQAARLYWPARMGAGFRRDATANDVNGLLNYGYAVLRAAVARAILAAGLHPGIGVFHRHPGNPMPLADDLMEPFRPIFDTAVAALAMEDTSVNSGAKQNLAELLRVDLVSEDGTAPLGTAILRLASSLGECFETGRPGLILPSEWRTSDNLRGRASG